MEEEEAKASEGQIRLREETIAEDREVMARSRKADVVNGSKPSRKR